jgi:hypothetical protein
VATAASARLHLSSWLRKVPSTAPPKGTHGGASGRTFRHVQPTRSKRPPIGGLSILPLHDLDGDPDKAGTPGGAIWGIQPMASPRPVHDAHRIELRRDSIRKVAVQNQNAEPPCQSAFSPRRMATNQSGFGRASFDERIVASLPKAR